jgi:hypothetical protein
VWQSVQAGELAAKASPTPIQPQTVMAKARAQPISSRFFPLNEFISELLLAMVRAGKPAAEFGRPIKCSQEFAVSGRRRRRRILWSHPPAEESAAQDGFNLNRMARHYNAGRAKSGFCLPLSFLQGVVNQPFPARGRSGILAGFSAEFGACYNEAWKVERPVSLR